MAAVGFYQHLPISNPNSLQDITVTTPTMKAHDLLVQVNAVSVNPVDTGVRGGGSAQRLKHPKVLGWDAVGQVQAVGKEVTLFQPGDRVWYAGDFQRSGSNTQLQAVDERIVGTAPQNLSDEQAAAVPLVGLTAYESLFEKFSLQKNDKILIINGSGGVGSMAIQLAKLAGLTVIATASKPQSVAWVQDLGADFIIDHHQDLVSQMRALGFRYVDKILNLNNLDAHWSEIAELIKPDGQVVATTENHQLIDLQKLTKKRVTFSWEWMYSKSYYQLPSMMTQHDILSKLAKLYETKLLIPINKISYSPINATNLRQAHHDIESGRMVGKVILAGWKR
ncbi:zinc-binding alcohol dehydrogenase family protein [Bombilactobacillus folatiphilus]|uniref:Zinc-type alcohol dehydrogenase-like protein n=1 Tax=Bombilactobacillus folatiphilus TaxID=2923362 RepID=A0ABY4PC52_9LACO|nr:zinc-binding alcohol dehydrogenase family protein [Bombilactobacillus folatiphilus]UQS82842.1 zinc-binding alcohol dehydrogenase family protein [Bombilactobacillus folatiphilus]